MSKAQGNLLGIFITFAVILAFGYLIIFFAKPNPAEVLQRKKPVEQVDPTVLKTDLSKETSGLEVNGDLPVTVPDSELGRENPFSDF